MSSVKNKLLTTSYGDDSTGFSIQRVVQNQDGSFIVKHDKSISNPEKKLKGPSIKARYSECSDHMTNLNIMLDRKLVRELDYLRKEMRTNCRLISEKQRDIEQQYTKNNVSK